MKRLSPRALGRPLTAGAMVLSLVLLPAGGVGGAPQALGPDGHLRSIPASHPGRHTSVPGEVLVHFRHGEKPRSAASMGAKSLESLSVRGWTLVRLRGGESIDHAVARFRADPAIDNVTTNHVYYSETVPNDTLFGIQWGLQNTGQTVLGNGGTPGADISATTAWNTTTGSSSIVVAIADSGVNSAHPDLSPNVIAGQNFVPDRPPTSTWDGFGHGSHVAGIAGARGNNDYGVTGVAQRISIMPIRVLDNIGEGDTSWIAQGFDWAASHGAKVVNASFGGSDLDPVMHDAIAAHPNTLFVVAAGNASSNNDRTPDYPCNFSLSNLICVAASDQDDHLAGFSNYGAQSVDLAAPGVNIVSTYKAESAGDGDLGTRWRTAPRAGTPTTRTTGLSPLRRSLQRTARPTAHSTIGCEQRSLRTTCLRSTLNRQRLQMRGPPSRQLEDHPDSRPWDHSPRRLRPLRSTVRLSSFDSICTRTRAKGATAFTSIT